MVTSGVFVPGNGDFRPLNRENENLLDGIGFGDFASLGKGSGALLPGNGDLNPSNKENETFWRRNGDFLSAKEDLSPTKGDLRLAKEDLCPMNGDFSFAKEDLCPRKGGFESSAEGSGAWFPINGDRNPLSKGVMKLFIFGE